MRFSAEVFSVFVQGASPLLGAGAGEYRFVTQWGGPGTGNGEFNAPVGVAVDAWGNVYVSDSGNNRIQKFAKDP